MKKTELQKVRKDFGLRVRDLRKAKGYSQEEFAHECGVHRTYMGDVERGERNVSIDNIAKISQALGLKIKELF